MNRRSKWTNGALLVGVLCLVLYSIWTRINDGFEHKVIHDASLGQIVHGHLTASFEIPSGVSAFVLVETGREKRLLNGTATFRADNLTTLEVKFCQKDCPLAPVISGPGAGYYALSPCGDTDARIDLGKFGGQPVRFEIALDAPNVDAMDVRLMWNKE
jgi:hypothetical protein